MMKSDFFIKRIFPRKILAEYQRKITYLGTDTNINLNQFLNIKILLICISFILCMMYLIHGYIWGPIVVIIIYFGYDYIFLNNPIKKRANILEHDAIFFFEVLVLTLQSERNITSCLETTVSAIDSSLSREFEVALKEINLGKSLKDALNNLRMRIPCKSVDNIILNLIEANTYGNSIVGALKNQIDYITDKRILDIKGKINKMPTKVSIISVLFFLPLIMLLVLAPVLLTYFIK